MSPKTLAPTTETLATQLGYISDVLKANANEMTQEESLTQPQPAGNCFNWVVGHVLFCRNQMLELMGKSPVWSEEKAKRYATGSEPISGPGEGVSQLSEMLEAFDTSQSDLLDGLQEVSDEALSVEVPWFGKTATVAQALTGLVFHEAYHVGQTGVLRRIAGKGSGLGA